MSSRKSGGARVFCLILAIGAAALPGLSAETWDDALPSVEGQTIGAQSLPAPLSVYAPRSALNKATMGTLSSDLDLFMSALDFGALSAERTFIFAGIDEAGLNIGYGGKFGDLYMGLSYGGSLIDELYRRMTNQSTDSIFKQDIVTTTQGATPSTETLSSVLDGLGNRLLGEHANTSTLQILLGSGIFGFKFGFAQFLDSREAERSSVFESSLKPLVELGFNFRVGPVGVKTAFRGAYDIHQYNSNITTTFNHLWDNNGTLTEVPVNINAVRRLDFAEPSFGFTLGFDFGSGSTTAEFDLAADAAIRFYKNNDEDGVSGLWSIVDPANTSGYTDQTSWAIKAPDIFDLRIAGSPSFTYSADLSEQFTLGIKFAVGINYNILTVTQSLAQTGGLNSSIDRETSDTTLSIAPEVGAGISFRLLPERFALHAGFGVELFSYRQIKSEITQTGTSAFAGLDPEITITDKLMGLPTASFAAGFTLNFTAATALDLLAVSKNMDIDETKLTVLLSLKM
jgi:hypothetical protein